MKSIIASIASAMIMSPAAFAGPDGAWTCKLYERGSSAWTEIKSGTLPSYNNIEAGISNSLDLSVRSIFLSVKCESSTWSAGSKTYQQIACLMKDSMGQGTNASSYYLAPIELIKWENDGRAHRVTCEILNDI
jgi:hypothetical protein